MSTSLAQRSGASRHAPATSDTPSMRNARQPAPNPTAARAQLAGSLPRASPRRHDQVAKLLLESGAKMNFEDTVAGWHLCKVPVDPGLRHQRWSRAGRAFPARSRPAPPPHTLATPGRRSKRPSPRRPHRPAGRGRQAAYACNAEEVRRLITCRVSPSAADENGRTALVPGPPCRRLPGPGTPTAVPQTNQNIQPPCARPPLSARPGVPVWGVVVCMVHAFVSVR